MSLACAEAVPPEAPALLAALARARTAAVPLSELPGLWGLDDAGAAAALAGLQDEDLVDVWPSGPGNRPCAVLSTRAAALLGLELADSPWRGFRLRWIRRGEGADPGCAPVDGVFSETDASSPEEGAPRLFDLLPDPDAVDPAAAAGESDRLSHPKTAGKALGALKARGRVPEPRILLGLRPAWPVRREKGKPCPGCGGGSLSLLEACLACDRSGNEHLLGPVAKSERPRRYVEAEGGLAGGTAGTPRPGKVKAKAAGRKTPKGKAYTPPARNSFDMKARRAWLEGKR
jgi:hypothetical protein